MCSLHIEMLEIFETIYGALIASIPLFNFIFDIWFYMIKFAFCFISIPRMTLCMKHFKVHFLYENCYTNDYNNIILLVLNNPD